MQKQGELWSPEDLGSSTRSSHPPAATGNHAISVSQFGTL